MIPSLTTGFQLSHLDLLCAHSHLRRQGAAFPLRWHGAFQLALPAGEATVEAGELCQVSMLVCDDQVNYDGLIDH